MAAKTLLQHWLGLLGRQEGAAVSDTAFLIPGQNCLRLKAWEEHEWSCEAGVCCFQGGFSARLFAVCGVEVGLSLTWPSALGATAGPGRKSTDLE